MMELDDILWVIDELRVSDAEERRHIERIHILLTTAIIASYFSPTAQEVVSTQNIRFYTDSLMFISLIYLVFRLIDVTIPIRNFHKVLDVIFGVFAPLGFLISILGYLALAFIAIFGLNISSAQLAVIAVSVLIISLQLAILKVKHESEEENNKETMDSVFGRAMEFRDFVYRNPERIEDGLEWEYHEKNKDSVHPVVDLVGKDKEGNQVYGELKLGNIGSNRARRVVDILSEIPDESRALLITNGSLMGSAKAILDAESIEVKRVQMNLSK